MATISENGAAPRWGGPRRRALKLGAQLVSRFSAAAHHVGLFRETSSSAGIPGLTGPRVLHVEVGGRPYLMVKALPGQVLADFVEHTDRLAAGMRVDRVRITERAHGVFRVDINPPDPLAEGRPLGAPIGSGMWPISFGVLENGSELRESLVDCGHLAAQGQTRSGKTRWVYGLLGQLAGAAQIEIAGIDPTGKLLGPWQDTPQGSVICADSAYEVMERASRQLVDDMRDRIRAIPRDLDVLPVSREFPLRLVVLEEWANALTIASIAKGKAKGLDTELGRNVQMLLAEGHKVGYRCLLLTQRMDGTLVGTFNRDNISHRVSFRTASKDGLKLLHEHIDDITAEQHATEDPGIALVQAPSMPLARLRAHTIASYSDYLGRIDAVQHAAWTTAS